MAGVWVAGVGADWCLEPGLKNSSIDTGLLAILGDNGRGKSNSHCIDDDVLEIHKPLSNLSACLLDSNFRGFRG